MSFKDQLDKDLDLVFFNEYEFDVIAVLDDGDSKKILVKFDLKEDVVFDTGFDSDVSSSVPSITCKGKDVTDVKREDQVTVDGEVYFILDMDPAIDGIRVIYLSKDRS